MKILVANLGSTSFKYRLFDLPDEGGSDGVGLECELARGGVERIGAAESRVYAAATGSISPTAASVKLEAVMPVPDHAVALQAALTQLTGAGGPLQRIDDVAAIGFKAVHGGRISGVVRVSSDVLAAMDEVSQVAPAHNPPYVRAMRLLAERLPNVPLVAAFETGFHATIPQRNALYAVPMEWVEKYQIKRWGFHGASHAFVSQRLLTLASQRPLRAVICHLGGSSSVCWTLDGKSVGTSMGMSPQSGLPQNNRAGDFDPFALLHLATATGKSCEELLQALSTQCGLAGMSDTSGDMRDLEQAADLGHARAQVAIDVFVASIRHWVGAGIVELGGLDALAFTGGIGENSCRTRAAVCKELVELGIEIDTAANAALSTGLTSNQESEVGTKHSRVSLWVIPTNEELVVARQTRDLLAAEKKGSVCSLHS